MKFIGTYAITFTLMLAGANLSAQTTAVTPTVTQLLDAANAEYVLGGVPGGMTPFLENGKPLKLNDDVTGAIASTWVTPQHQVVIAYQGTSGGENLLTNPAALITQVITDAGVTFSVIDVAAPGLVSSLNFAKTVVSAANAQGYSNVNIFVTGHSLGGIEAEYVSSQTGLAGIGFESCGLGSIAQMSNVARAGSNFIDIVTAGDPIGNISSDIPGDLIGYMKGGGGLFPHYGSIVEIGDMNDQASLNFLTIIPNTLIYHLPGVQAHDLGVTLNPYSAVIDGLGDQTAGVWNVGSDTIPQLLAAAKATGRYYPS